MEDSQFYNEMQFYGTWSAMVLCALWIAFEIYIWSEFLSGIKTWFFRSLIALLVFYAVYNGSLIILAIDGTFEWARITIQDFNAIQLQRMYSHAIIPFVTAFLMRVVNSRSREVSHEDQKVVISAARILARNNRQIDRANSEINRAKQVEKRINEYLHSA